MPLRPAGTDGSDASYRMTIDKRYMRLAGYRKWLWRSSVLLALYVGFKLAWRLSPALLAGRPLLERTRSSVPEELPLAFGIACVLLYFIVKLRDVLRGAEMAAEFLGFASLLAVAYVSSFYVQDREACDPRRGGRPATAAGSETVAKTVKKGQ